MAVINHVFSSSKKEIKINMHIIEVDGWSLLLRQWRIAREKEHQFVFSDIPSARFTSHPHLATRLMASFHQRACSGFSFQHLFKISRIFRARDFMPRGFY